MVDNRLYTFLELCDEMNYRRTAEKLNMTQPAVTQHIKYLEGYYGCKLFEYSNRKLYKTEQCTKLERRMREVVAHSLLAKQDLQPKTRTKVSIGATKTIGEYMIEGAVLKLLASGEYDVNIIIDNTENLLSRLNHFELDLLMIEGFVDKERYEHRYISTEQIVGICAEGHPFAGKEVPREEVFAENVILREKGSGTRAVFENFLFGRGFSVGAIGKHSVVSSNKLIEAAVQSGCAVSFVYDVIPKKNKKLATFKIKGGNIYNEFNYVFLSSAAAERTIEILDKAAEA